MANTDTVQRVVVADGVSYAHGRHPVTGAALYRTAARGDTIEVSAAEAERLDRLGGTLPPDEAAEADTDTGGYTAPTDEKLAAASVDDLAAILQQAPEDDRVELLDRVDALEDQRVEAARADGKDDAKRRKGVDELLDAYDYQPQA